MYGGIGASTKSNLFWVGNGVVIEGYDSLKVGKLWLCETDRGPGTGDGGGVLSFECLVLSEVREFFSFEWVWVEGAI